MERVKPISGIEKTKNLMIHLTLSYDAPLYKVILINGDLPFSPANARGFYVGPKDLKKFLDELKLAGYCKINDFDVCETMGGIYGSMIHNKNMFPKDIEIVVGEDRCPGSCSKKAALWVMDFGMVTINDKSSPRERMDQIFADLYIPSDISLLGHFLYGFIDSAINRISFDTMKQYAESIVESTLFQENEEMTTNLAKAMYAKDLHQIFIALSSIN